MDVLTLLKADHKRVQSLFQRFLTENARQQQRLLFASIKQELEEHTFAEETVFYPYFSRYENFSEIIRTSYRDHARVKNLLSDLAAKGIQHPDFFAGMSELIRNVEAHVQEEEDHLFPMVKTILPGKDREILGRHLMSAKQELEKAA